MRVTQKSGSGLAFSWVWGWYHESDADPQNWKASPLVVLQWHADSPASRPSASCQQHQQQQFSSSSPHPSHRHRSQQQPSATAGTHQQVGLGRNVFFHIGKNIPTQQMFFFILFLYFHFFSIFSDFLNYNQVNRVVDPDPHGPAFNFLCLKVWPGFWTQNRIGLIPYIGIRIEVNSWTRIQILIKTKADSQHCR